MVPPVGRSCDRYEPFVYATTQHVALGLAAGPIFICNCARSYIFVCFARAVLHSGDYYLFESDSEDEDVLEEDQKQHKQSPFQVFNKLSESDALHTGPVTTDVLACHFFI